MKIIKSCILVLLLDLAAGPVAPAQATTTTHLVQSGTSANLQLVSSIPSLQAACLADVTLYLMGSSSLQRTGSVASQGAFALLIINDACAGVYEYGSVFVSLSSGFSTGVRSAALSASIPVVMDHFGPDGFTNVTRTLQTNLQWASSATDTVSGFNHSRYSSQNISFVQNGRSVFSYATLTGQVTLDGSALITPTAGATASIETSMSASVDISR